MEKKDKKKGFFASLFSPKKPCSCSCGSMIVEDDNDSKDVAPECCATAGKETPCCGTSADKVTEVKVLGPGCAKCKTTYSVVERVIKESGLDVKLTKVEDIAEMMNYNILSTPAVVVDGEVRIKGHVPTEDEVKKILGI